MPSDVAAPLTGLVDRLHAALPQTQCQRCGYPDCRGYAEALARGDAELNQCPPGGAEGVQRLAHLLQRPALPLNPEHGLEGPRTVVVIDENWCIGCTLCIKVCPTDAIVGANKRMHTIIPQACTGCELCIPACPVDCIEIRNASGERTAWQAWTAEQAQEALKRYQLRAVRVVRQAREHAERLRHKAETKLADLPAHSLHTDPEVLERKRRIIEAALAKARSRQGGAG